MYQSASALAISHINCFCIEQSVSNPHKIENRQFLLTSHMSFFKNICKQILNLLFKTVISDIPIYQFWTYLVLLLKNSVPSYPKIPYDHHNIISGISTSLTTTKSWRFYRQTWNQQISIYTTWNFNYGDVTRYSPKILKTLGLESN